MQSVLQTTYAAPETDLPTDPPEVAQTRIRVQNLHDVLADSKPTWEPICYLSHSELSLFVQMPFSVAKAVKNH